MGQILNENFDYDYNGTLLSEIMFKPSDETPALDSFARIIPGSQFKIQIPISGILAKILKAGKGCGRTQTGTGFSLTNQTVTLSPLKMFMEECAETFETSIGNNLAEEWLKSGNDRNDISGTELLRVVDQLLEDSLRRDVFRIFSFADSTDPDTDYDQLDGLWTTLIANSGLNGGSYCVRRTDSLGNGTLVDGAALAALKRVVEGSANILDNIPENQKDIKVTRSIYDNLVSSYESTSTGSDLQVTFNMEGIPQVRYRGIPVIKVSVWDTDLADTANPLNGTVVHLILYTTKENHVFAVGDNADLNGIKGWYSMDDDIYKFASKMRFGYNYLHCDLTTVAF